MLYKSASLSPITLVFTHKQRYICPILWKIFWGAPPKITPHFLDFSKKSATQKTRFFPADRNFGHRFLKKGPKSSIFGVPDRENVFWQTFDKKTPILQNFRSGPSPLTFYGLFSKKRFSDFYFSDFFSDFPRKPLKSRFFVENEQNLVVISREKIWKNMKISKTLFRI